MQPVVFSRLQPEPVLDHPRPERLLKGNPERWTQSYFASADRMLDCGVWSCEPGAWRIRFAASRDEFVVQEGRVRLHDEAGAIFDIGPGEAAVIPAGFVGVFEVLESVRKYYVLLERCPA